MTLVRNPFAAALVLLHLYIGVRLLPALGLAAGIAAAVLLAVCFWLMPKGYHVREERRAWMVLLRWLSVGFFSWLLVLTLGRDVILLAALPFASAATHAAWTQASAVAGAILTPLITLIGFVMARRVARVVEVEVRVADLPAPLEG